MQCEIILVSVTPLKIGREIAIYFYHVQVFALLNNYIGQCAMAGTNFYQAVFLLNI